LYFAPFAAFAQVRDYFADPQFNPDSGAPASYGADYYDKVGAQKCLWDLTPEEWFNGPHATGSWGCVRPVLDNNGISQNISYLGNFAANPSGGMSRGAANSSSVNLGLGVDLKKLSGVESLDGWSIVNTWVWRFGDSLTNERLGNEFNVQQNYGSQTVQLQSLYAAYMKSVLADWDLTFKFGRFAAGDNFMAKPIYWLYQNNAFDGTPVGVFKQMKFSAYPGSTWAAFAQVREKDGGYVKAGVYQINTPKQDSSQGLDWSFNGDGVNATFEIGKDFNHDGSGKSPANLSAGVAADWYDAPRNDDPSKYSYFNCSVYVQADYMIWNMGPVKENQPHYIVRDEDKWRDLRGIVLWGVVQYSPYENLSTMPIFVNGGLLFNAPFASRADDVLCFGIAYGKYSNTLLDVQKNASYETVFELNYKFQINRFAFIQPNVQYILNPSGGKYGDAVVLGIQFGLNL